MMRLTFVLVAALMLASTSAHAIPDDTSTATKTAGLASTSSMAASSTVSAPIAPKPGLASEEGWVAIDTSTTPQAPYPEGAPRREVTDADGRAEPGTSTGDALLWVPRVLLSPIWLVTEYLLRRPVGAVVTWAEREKIPLLVIDLFTFDGQRGGIVPTLAVDFGFRPNVGLFAWYNETFGLKANDFRASVAVGGNRWIAVSALDRIHLSDEEDLELVFRLKRRPDYIYNGLGPTSDQDLRTRYFRHEIAGELRYIASPWRWSEFRAELVAAENRFNAFEGSPGTDELDLGTAIDMGLLPPPAGLDGYTSGSFRLDATADTRHEGNLTESGLRLHMALEFGADFKASKDMRWVKAFGAVEGITSLGGARTLGLYLFTENLNDIGGTPAPFTEYPQTSTHPLRLGGFLPGRLTGQSDLGVGVEYRYEVWAALWGNAFYTVGNVFGEGYEGFGFGKLRQSFGLGLKSTGDKDAGFNLLFAFGTNTFDDGAGVESFRFVLGGSTGF